MTKHSVKRRTLCCALAIALALCSLFALGSVSLAINGNPEICDGYWQIDDAADLAWFRDAINGTISGYGTNLNAQLTNNITLPSSWTPIGTSARPYTGIFETLDNTSVIFNGSAGLFNYHAGTVRYINAYGTVSGSDYVGAIAAHNSGTISYCTTSSTATVSGANYVGGIVGDNAGTITNCTNAATIAASGEKVAGIAGVSEAGNITGCSNTGAVTGDRYVAGITGGNFPTALTNGIITKCCNTATITTTQSSKKAFVGGIAGQSKGTIQYCYNQGTISGSDHSRAGGIAGANYNGTWSGSTRTPNANEASLIQYCYNTGTIAAAYSGDGAITGETEGNVLVCYFLTNCEQHNEGIGIVEAGTDGTIEAPDTASETLPIGMKSVALVTALNANHPFVNAPFVAVTGGYPTLSAN